MFAHGLLNSHSGREFRTLAVLHLSLSLNFSSLEPTVKELALDIWAVADLLRGDYKRAEYGKVILPFTILTRLDGLLAPFQKEIQELLQANRGVEESILEIKLLKVSGYKFFNRSAYDFVRLKAEAGHVAANLRNHIAGYSASVREIFEHFHFEEQIERLDKAGLIYQVVEFFANKRDTFAKISGLHMGYVFEELIRKFAEESNETAGEHFTPREVIHLMVNLVFDLDRDSLSQKGSIRTLYDPTAGTGGMLSVAEEYIQKLNPDAQLRVFGQELNPESYAICKADMLIKGQNISQIKLGNTLSAEGHSGEFFDYMLANPPFGVDWKKAEKAVKAEHENKGHAGRFGPGLPRINDGSFLFLLHMLSKMKSEKDSNGTRMAIVFNGSPLFSGAAESGESKIRQHILENDYLEAIVALPDQLFYNTGIFTYIWVLSNRKAANRKGKVQLVNAVQFWEKMPRSMGNKRKFISEEQIQEITRLYGDFTENAHVKIFPTRYFGYHRITVERPFQAKDGQLAISGIKAGKKKADPSLRDYENVPFKKWEDGKLVDETIEAYFKREVLPHVPDAWVDLEKTKIGYEINFTRYFYQYQKPRSLDEIRADILRLEEETEGMLKEVL